MRLPQHHVFPALILIVLVSMPASTHADEVDDLQTRVTATNDRIKDIRQFYKEKDEQQRRFEFETRLQEGRLLLELGDDARASVVFFDILNNEQWKNRPGSKEAIWLLAQALYRSNNQFTARTWLENTLERGRPEDKEPAAILLINLSLEMRDKLSEADWDKLEQTYQRLQGKISTFGPELLYARGKILYARARYQEAINALSRVNLQGARGLEARYIQGAVHVRLSDIAAAMVAFEAVISEGISRSQAETLTRKEFDILELAHVAKARLHYEQKQFVEALDTYQFVGRNSRHFDRVLFEITWTHIAKKDLDMALRSLDILLLARPDSVFMPDAKRLRADLLKDQGKYGKAISTYKELTADFKPVLAELDDMVGAKPGTPEAEEYFQTMVARDKLGKGEYLPAAARQWVPDSPEMLRAKTMVSELGESYANISESRLIIDEIKAAIQGENRYQLFPELREGWQMATNLENRTLSLRRDLNELEALQVLPSLSSDQRRKYEEARKERQQLQQKFNSLPQDREAYAKRSQQLRNAIEDRHLRAFRVRNMIESAESQARAMETWLAVRGQDNGMSPQQEIALREGIKATFTEVERLKRELIEAERQVRVLDTLGGIDASLVERENDIRKRFAKALERESSILSAASQSRDPRFDAMGKDIKSMGKTLNALRKELSTTVDGRIQDIRSRLHAETQQVEREEVNYKLLQHEVEVTAGHIAYQHWEEVRATFSDLILAADVGIVDVSWLQKEAATLKRERLQRNKNRELDLLKQEFDALKRESGGLTEDDKTPTEEP